MNRETLERVLAMVKAEMGAEAARLEIGGDPPDDPQVFWAPTPSGFRLVVLYERAPEDPVSVTAKLRQLATAFFDHGLQPPSVRPDAEQNLNQRRLDDELLTLSARTNALGALVFDLKSPVVWGSSEGRPLDEDLDTWEEFARVDERARSMDFDLAIVSGLSEADRGAALESFDGAARLGFERVIQRLQGRSLKTRRSYLLRARAVAEVRAALRAQEGPNGGLRRLSHGDSLGYFARSFAGIYVVLVYFPGPFSELQVEGSALHALPLLEHLVLSLPPVDPPPSGGKVVKLVPR